MKRSVVEDTIKTYLSTEEPLYAIMVSGAWGAGKSTLVRNVVSSENNLKVIFVSCFGVTSKADLENKIFEGAFSIKEVSESSIKASARLLSGVTNAFASKDAGGVVGAFSEVASDLLKSRVMGKIGSSYCLVFDDVERSKLSPAELFSVVNLFVEERKSRCILVANEREVDNELDGEYKQHKEKVIGYTCFLDDVVDIVGKVSAHFEPYERNVVINFLDEYDCSNIRTIKIALQFYKELKNSYSSVKSTLGAFYGWGDAEERQFFSEWLGSILVLTNATKNLGLVADDFECSAENYSCNIDFLKKGRSDEDCSEVSLNERLYKNFFAQSFDLATWNCVMFGYTDKKAIKQKVLASREKLGDPLCRLVNAIIGDFDVDEIGRLIGESREYIKSGNVSKFQSLGHIFWQLAHLWWEVESNFDSMELESIRAEIDAYLDNVGRNYIAIASPIRCRLSRDYEYPIFPFQEKCMSIQKLIRDEVEVSPEQKAQSVVIEYIESDSGEIGHESFAVAAKSSEFVDSELYLALVNRSNKGRADFVRFIIERYRGPELSDSASKNLLRLSDKLLEYTKTNPEFGQYWIRYAAMCLQELVSNAED